VTDTEATARTGPTGWRWLLWAAAVVLMALALGVIVPPLFDERMRATIESQMNARLEGYSVTLGAADVRLFGLSIKLRDLTLRQDAYPDPPVAAVPALHTSVQWDALLRGRLVADFLFDGPAFHFNLEQLREEIADEMPVEERGWREALEAAHFFDFNLIRIRSGTLTYIDDDPERPLEVEDIQFVASSIRASPGVGNPYPSPFQLEAIVFGEGLVRVDGRADFLADPSPALAARFDVATVPLTHFRPVLARAGVVLTDGVLDAAGSARIDDETTLLHLAQVHGHDLHADYIYTNPAAADDDGNGNAVDVIAEGPDPEALQLLIDHLELTGDLGFVHEGVNPSFRAFITEARLVLTNYSNRFRNGDGIAMLSGQFMGSGRTHGAATFRHEDPAPDFTLALEIHETHLPTMNDILRAYGNFDVHEGYFSFFTELTIREGEIDGYMRPIFGDMVVYDAREDDDKGLIQQLYEIAVGAISTILKNLPREEVATHVEISGELDDPEMSTWDILVGLIQNAFFQAILPGFEGQLDDD
jgi:hypothetical protein